MSSSSFVQHARGGALVVDMPTRLEFHRIGRSDEETLSSFYDVAKANSVRLIEAFYEHLMSFSETRRHIKDETQLARLKETQRYYFLQLFAGVYDHAYGEGRKLVGQAHERIGLEPQWYIGAYAHYMTLLIDLAHEHFGKDVHSIREFVKSVVKLISLDMGIAIDVYIDAMKTREAEQIKAFVDTLSSSAQSLESSSSGLLESAGAQSATASEIATSVSKVTNTLTELRSSSEQTLKQAELVIDTGRRSLETAQTGIDAVNNAVDGMRKLRNQVETIATSIQALEEHVEQIGKLNTTVDEIATQSKLLAFNAAIEAAHAGEKGKGFAVVASQLGELSEQSKHATLQVRSLIDEVMAATQAAVADVKQGSELAESGLQRAEGAGEQIQTLLDATNDTATAANAIAEAARQQGSGIQDAADAMDALGDSSATAASNASQTEERAGELDGLASRMTDLVEEFSSRG